MPICYSMHGCTEKKSAVLTTEKAVMKVYVYITSLETVCALKTILTFNLF